MRSIRARLTAVALVALMMLGAVPAVADDAGGDQEPVVERIAGDGRVATAIEIARTTFDQSDMVVMAYAHEYPDALVAAPLARALEAPLILNDRDRMFPGVSEELERLDPETVILAGGTNQLGPEVVEGIEALGIGVDRVSGSTRFGTAAAVAERLTTVVDEPIERVFVTEGVDEDPLRGWPDALAVAPYAAHVGSPTLLVDTDLIPEDIQRTIDAMSPAEIVIVGGEGAVSAQVEQELAASGADVRRIAGATRFETGAAVYDEALQAGMAPATTWLATGGNYPDALAAGATVAARGDAMMLVDAHDLDRSPPTRDRLAATRDDLDAVWVLGGPAAVSDAVLDQIRTVVGGS